MGRSFQSVGTEASPLRYWGKDRSWKEDITMEKPTMCLAVCYVLRDISIMTSTFVDVESLRRFFKKFVYVRTAHKQQRWDFWQHLLPQTIVLSAIPGSLSKVSSAPWGETVLQRVWDTSNELIEILCHLPFSRETLILKRLKEFFETHQFFSHATKYLGRRNASDRN